MASRVTGQLVNSTRQMKEFSNLNFFEPVPESGLYSPIKEISRIYEALNVVSVCVGLRIVFFALPS